MRRKLVGLAAALLLAGCSWFGGSPQDPENPIDWTQLLTCLATECGPCVAQCVVPSLPLPPGLLNLESAPDRFAAVLAAVREHPQLSALPPDDQYKVALAVSGALGE